MVDDLIPKKSENAQEGPWTKYQRDASAKNSEAIRAHLFLTSIFALAPPAVLFVLGWAALWIGRGFFRD